MVKIQLLMQEVWVQSLGQEDPLKKEMATHSSILAGKIPWTEVTVHEVAKSWTQLKRLRMYTLIKRFCPNLQSKIVPQGFLYFAFTCFYYLMAFMTNGKCLIYLILFYTLVPL